MTLITGHRGARNLWPENSLAGFRNTLKLGVDAIEFDVHLTETGELVVIHDATLERTTEGFGPVRKLTSEEQAGTQARPGIRLKDTDEIIPTLADVLTVLSSRDGPGLHVEIKTDETGTPYPDIAGRVAEELRRFGVEDRTHLTSFDISVLVDCRRHAPHVARLVSVNADWAERQGGLAAFLARVDGLVDIIAIQQELMEAQWELVRAALPLDRLCVWTVNEEATIRYWLERRIGRLTSDRPDLAIALRSAMVTAAPLETNPAA
jgi:glycerophosphoryl diester phosphodiesterase